MSRATPLPAAPKVVPGLALIILCFSNGGPLHKAIEQMTGLPQVWRAPQAAAAQVLWRQMGWGEALAGRVASQAALLTLQEVWPGIGKTLVYGLCSAFYVLQYGQRAMIAVTTTEDRAGLVALAPLINQVVRATHEAAGLPAPREIVFQERIALSSLFSPSRVESLRSHPMHKPKTDLYRFFDWYDWWDAPQDRTISGWFEYLQSNDQPLALPLGLSEDALRMQPHEETTEIVQSVTAALASDVADVVVVTHAMLMTNSRYFGTILKTRERSTVDENDLVPFGTLIVDEADRLPMAANAQSRTELRLGDCDDHLTTVALKAPKVVRQAVELLRKSIANLDACIIHSAGQPEGAQLKVGTVTVRSATTGLAAEMTGLIRNMIPQYEALIALLPETGNRINRSVLGDHERKFRRFLDEIEVTEPDRSIEKKVANTNSDRRGKIVCRVSQRQHPIGSPVQPSGSEVTTTLIHEDPFNTWVIRNLWRAPKPGRPRAHVFKSVYCASGTMLDAGGQWDDLKMCYGIDSTIDTNVHYPGKITHTMGAITSLYMTPTLENLKPTLHGAAMKASPGMSSLNPEHLDLLAQTVEYKANQTTDRGLVLCGSYEQRDELIKRLHKVKGLDKRIIIRDHGERRSEAIKRYANQPGAIWIGIDYYGVNFVAPSNGETLPKFIILARILQPPTTSFDIPRAGNWNAAIEHNRQEGYRRMVQAIARAIRSPQDSVEVYILDPRFPAPAKCYKMKAFKIAGLGREPKLLVNYRGFETALRALSPASIVTMRYGIPFGVLQPNGPPVVATI